ncbi:MAG: amidohydrolase [Anaerolineae bacterium]|nr:amidohydrolase [Anaerolineae bacterium]
MTLLADHIQNLTLIDTHEHLEKEPIYTDNGPDVLCDLFQNYVAADLAVAGASAQALNALFDRANTDIEARWDGIKSAWANCQYTGYGEAVRLIAQEAYGMAEITLEGIVAAQTRNQQLRQPGERLRILRDVGNYDHVQIDDFTWVCRPDESGPGFFLYDLSWVNFVNGEPDLEALQRDTDVEVRDLDTLREGMARLFERFGPFAIAVKTQHAYDRTLLWQERQDSDVEPVLQKHISGAKLSENERLILGDWGLARGVELAMEYNLPVKIHTGYYAGHSHMPIERIKPGHLCALLLRYPDARFVLMHISYPYNDELVAIAKHYPNVWVDLCWAWSIDPYTSMDFVRKMIHAVPSNKLFAFGGDTSWPNSSVAYAQQMRRWLTRALEAEVGEGYLTETQAVAVATKLMNENQKACFDIEGRRATIKAALSAV